MPDPSRIHGIGIEFETLENNIQINGTGVEFETFENNIQIFGFGYEYEEVPSEGNTVRVAGIGIEFEEIFVPATGRTFGPAAAFST